MLQNLTSQYFIFHMEAMLAFDVTSTEVGLGWLIHSVIIYVLPFSSFAYIYLLLQCTFNLISEF